ncbi:hypothetical protein ACWGPQ_17230 [Saccharomonospora azurea]|uniref:hypothetical protein n=1 Tax=Saccharomonospora azurea TaxID=40988 RepID=UPI00023FED61|nr:hypothetical protein [Saccharomonospora azurea]EHK88423.1 hypothetical protein SZMC14600_05327 [Saccharomonospora azurea SZMC 14600]
MTLDDTVQPNEQSRRERPRRRKTLDDVFGDVLPDTTRDERDSSSSAGLSDDWYRENRPPHHDR